MSTSSLEQAILKISKVMEDFVVQDSIEKLTNLDIARGKRKLPPQPHHNLQGTNAKRSRKVLMIDTLVGDCYDNFMDQPSIENHKVQDDKGLLEPFKSIHFSREEKRNEFPWTKWKDANLFGIQGEFSMKYNACKNRNGGETEETGEPKCISKALSGISHHEHTQCEFFAQ
ncbi:hypothetical protein CK203_103641 [Vitis vinifera]|uniref:Uncharacterized protein n=1 Tax=Vitis vinifera TaxID=29760 RepID=A0A438BPY8_VITVI|nr:hypothetical protein CK203_103641 [Vitis vinifera]